MSEDTSPIPLLDLEAEVDHLWDELNEAIQRVLRSGQFILGPEVERFEQDAAEYLGVEHAVGLNSGTDALVIGLRALGVEEGDEVITTPFTFFATAEAISIIGAEPVFVDIDPVSFNLDPSKIESAITPQTEAIVPVHLFGAPAAMTQIMEIAKAHDLKVLEDCAQSFGAQYGGECAGCRGKNCEPRRRANLDGKMTGAIGHAGAFSFFPTKNLGAYGDGGMLVTDNRYVAETARMLRKHGGKNKYHNEVLGYNSRLDSIQAAILNVKLSYVEKYNKARRENARRYSSLLANVDGIVTPKRTKGHVFHQYTVRVKDGRRDHLRKTLSDRQIGNKVYYPVPCHKLPVYENEELKAQKAENAADEVLSLPMWPQMTKKVQNRVTSVLKTAVGM